MLKLKRRETVTLLASMLATSLPLRGNPLSAAPGRGSPHRPGSGTGRWQRIALPRPDLCRGLVGGSVVYAENVPASGLRGR